MKTKYDVKKDSSLENMLMNALVLSAALVHAFLLPSFKIGLLILFLYGVSVYFVVRFILNIHENLEPRGIESINKTKLFLVSCISSAILPFSLPILFVWGVLITLKNVFKESDSVNYRLLELTAFLYSTKTQKEVFEPCVADWNEEIYESLKKNKDASLFMINVRNTYAFLTAMWQKSPIGDLIEFVVKIAKQ
jgi:hypothetical protein